MKEYKLGQIVTVGRVKTRVTKSNGSCEGCIGQKIEGARLCHTCECRNSYRVDKNDIIFKPIDSTPTPKDENSALDESKHSEFPLPPENMRVWIRGNKERGEEVIRALTDLGAKNINKRSGECEDAIYSVDKHNKIDCLSTDSDIASLVVNFYKEIKLPWKPKDKELVWAWDENFHFGKMLMFYDSKNRRSFNTVLGNRTGYRHDHYAPYEGEWPEWAKEAVKKLEE